MGGQIACCNGDEERPEMPADTVVQVSSSEAKVTAMRITCKNKGYRFCTVQLIQQRFRKTSVTTSLKLILNIVISTQFFYRMQYKNPGILLEGLV